MTVPVVFAIAGVIALLISIWGGGVRAKEIEIPSAPLKARLLVGFVGLLLIGVSIWLTFPTENNAGLTSPILTPTDVTASVATSISTKSESTNWAVTFEYRIPIGTWSAGLHQYTLTATCPGEGTNSITNKFTVSNNFAIKDGDVYLRYAGLRLSETYGAEAVEGINPLQPIVAVVTSDQITKTEAEWRAINCSGTVSWDGGTPVPLIAQTPFQH